MTTQTQNQTYRERDLISPRGLFKISSPTLRKLIAQGVFPEPSFTHSRKKWWPREAVIAAIPALQAKGYGLVSTQKQSDLFEGLTTPAEKLQHIANLGRQLAAAADELLQGDGHAK